LVNEEIRRGREKGESDRVNLFLIHPCINNGMGEWEGIVLGVPAYTTKNKDFCFCTQLEIRGARWGGKGTGGKYVPALREWWVSFTRTRQNVRSAVELGSSPLLQGSSRDSEVLEAGERRWLSSLSELLLLIGTRGRENDTSPIPRSAFSVGSKNSSVSSGLWVGISSSSNSSSTALRATQDR